MIANQTHILARCLLGVAGAVLLGIQSPVLAKNGQKFPYTGTYLSQDPDK